MPQREMKIYMLKKFKYNIIIISEQNFSTASLVQEHSPVTYFFIYFLLSRPDYDIKLNLKLKLKTFMKGKTIILLIIKQN